MNIPEPGLYKDAKIIFQEITEDRRKWDLRFLGLARYISDWSKDCSTKVGSVIVDPNKRIVSLGYNGFPQKIEDRTEDINNRDTKLLKTIHAETNAILFANKLLDNCTIYTWPFQPCSRCTTSIIQVGISRVVAPESNIDRWKEDFELAKGMFKEAGIKLDLLELPIV